LQLTLRLDITGGRLIKELGYNINTGEPIHHISEQMVHVGNGYYERACDITQEDLDRRKRFFMSISAEVYYLQQGWEES